MKRINRDGPRVLGTFAHPPRLAPESIATLMDPHSEEPAFVLDLRAARAFAKGHVPRTLSIPYNKSFATWAGWLVPYDVDIVLLADGRSSGETPAAVERAVHDLTLIGLDRVTGWLDVSALDAWVAAGESLSTVSQLSVEDLSGRLASGDVRAIDVRGHAEYESGHLPGVPNIPVGMLTERLRELPPTPLVLQCQSGSRSSIAASVLLREGRRDVYNLTGGIIAWESAGFGIERAGHHAHAGQ